MLCDLPQKIEVLFSFIKSHLKSKTLVFVSSRKEVRFLYESFKCMKPGVPLLQLHGKQKQTMRTHTYYDFVSSHPCSLQIVAEGGGGAVLYGYRRLGRSVRLPRGQ